MRGRARARLDAGVTGATIRRAADPRTTLTSLGGTVYTWDAATDAIVWGANAAEVFGIACISGLATGQAFARAVEPGSGLARHEAILAAKGRDRGGGVPYRIRCAIRCRSDGALLIEDAGRWFARADGEAAFAHGVVRVVQRAGKGQGRAQSRLAQPCAPDDLALDRTEGSRRAGVLDVIDALNARRVAFALQPVVDAGSRERAFSEALVRVRTEDGRFLNAGEILPAVERAGLVPLIDIRVLELTADYLAAHPDERVAINVSPLTLDGPDWLTTLAAHVGARPGIAPRLIVEVTETAAIRDPDATRARLDVMKALGVAIAIDDFGAGHTSFRHLRSFPVDILKIDGAFVQNLSRSADDRFFVRTLIDLAHHLGLLTVAEWVEDEDSARMLADWGVDYLQGEHCGLPAVIEAGERAKPWCRVA